MSIDLFPKDQIIGVFRGFQQGGLEFHADLVLPYRNDFQCIPMHGQFILVQLETPEEAVLGRIASFSSEGKLSIGSGEEFNIRAMREERPIPEDLREQYLKYKVNIRVLGVLRNGNGGNLNFIASHRRLPHVGSKVAFPSGDVLREIAGHNILGESIGHFALGEYIYAAAEKDFKCESWMQLKDPAVHVKFPIKSLVSRRSFVFARAGFGKSNLNKLLFSQLYRETPTVEKRAGRMVPVGTVIFDPDGEYFWPDDKGRPGLCDVPWLQDKLVVFTERKNTSDFYQSFVAGGIKLDIRRLRPADVISIALSPDKQDQQNVRKLKGLSQPAWEKLVELIDKNGNSAPLDEICIYLSLEEGKQDAEAVAARSNMTTIVRMLHDKGSQLMDMLMESLANGKLCVVDVSQMRGGQALVLSGIILRRIFDRNQEEFTSAEPKTIPTIAVVEEAQSVLSENSTTAEPYIAWVKEGRKYDLGALLITQQPGSIPNEILSQGDNWFIFHLLSAGDLASVKKANAHFSDDLLSSLLNEPIPGQGVFWSSVEGKPYPVPIRVLSFEQKFSPLDKDYNKPSVQTYAGVLRKGLVIPAQAKADKDGGENSEINLFEVAYVVSDSPIDESDVLAVIERNAIEALRGNTDLMSKIKETGMPWGGVKAFLESSLPEKMDDKSSVAYYLVAKALDQILGPQDKAWESFKHPSTHKTWIRKI